MELTTFFGSARFRLLFSALYVFIGYQVADAQGDTFTFSSPNPSDYQFCIDYHVGNHPTCVIDETSWDINVTQNHPNPNAGIFYISVNTTNPNGNLCGVVGPSFNQNVYGWSNHIAFGPCIEQGEVAFFNVTTHSFYPPANVQATDGDFDTQIVITWDKATYFPDNLVTYEIYRNQSLLTSVLGTARSYTDAGLTPGQSYTYSVHTRTLSFGDITSNGTEDMGSTFSVGLTATEGDHFSKTKLSWNDLSKVSTDLRIERSIPGPPAFDREELDILNRNATTYSDVDGIPGFPYVYYVTPISDSVTFLTDSVGGWSRPNGKITGHVYSPQGAGVDSVEIYVTLLDGIPNGGTPLDPGCTTTYCAMTDISGYYEIVDVYYYEEADFQIYPKKDTHHFEPDTLVRTMSQNTTTQSFIDFTDLNVITVGGRVTFPDGPGPGGPCGVEGVSILIDGKDIGLLTDDHGDWATSVNNEATYKFSAKLHDHVYEDPQGNTTSTLYVAADNTNINFENKTNRTIKIIAQGGCSTSLGSSVQIRVTAPGNCFTNTYLTNQQGLLTINNLPPRDYSVEVINVNGAGSNTQNILDQLDIPIDIDLTELDTMLIITQEDSLKITPADTTITPSDTFYTPVDSMVIHYQDTMSTTEMTLRFIYRPDIEIKIDFDDAGADIRSCTASDTLIVMDQDKDYFLEINVKEMLGNCYIDTGTLVIYDEISDMEGFGQKIPISNGIARYLVQPGNPDIAETMTHNHQKFLFIDPKIDFLDPDPVTFWVLVTGIKSNTPSFITRTPEIPQLIVHDPPGDNSFATIEKGTTYTTTSSTEIQVGGSAGLYANLKAGPAADVFAAKVKAGGTVEFEAKAGRDNMNNDVTITTITFLESYSTSTSETWVGNPGDLFIGSAMNQTFALSQELKFDTMTCQTDLDTVVEMGFTDFATTFIYTEYHIVNSLIPTLETLQGLADTTTNDGKKEYNKLLADIRKWKSILAKNEAARDTNAVFKENISISSGADLTKSYGSVDGTQESYTYEIFFESSLKIGAFAELESPFFYLAAAGGVMANFRTSRTEVRDTLSETSRTVSYTISDNDIGDFFSINVLQDKAYDVPAFKIVSGTTSCPHEPNTAPRELPSIGVFPPIVNNVPPDEAAQFVLSITNNSGSGETRQYAIKVVSNTNPDGAIVNVAGSDINTFPIQYYFDANQTIELAMSVYRGPLASNYDSLGIEIYSECEYAIWGDGGNQTKSDTVWFSVNFLSECTNVSMYLPNEGWLVNQASDNELRTTFTGYDVDNPAFDGITLQMKRDGYGYTNQVTIPKAALVGTFYDYFLDVSDFPDGNYTLRARANCGLAAGYTYSSELSGTIDRTSLAPFGIPNPSDGFLREGQEVSVTFDKIIDCDFDGYPNEMSLVREDTHAEIPFTTSCFGNKVIINTNPPLLDQLNLEGVRVTARVHMLQDENGNIQEYPTEWSFLVNVSPVFWDPEDLYASGYEGQHNTIKTVLKNTSLLSKAFSLEVSDAPLLIGYPDWITPVQKRGTILSNNDFTIDFEVEDNLLPGIYTGVVTAMVDSLPVSMTVTYEHYAEPVNWHFNPSLFQYSMTAIVQFSLNGTNTNLSTDPRDVIGAFVNGQTRGISHIEYLPEINKYRAFLTIYSNDQGGPTNGEKIKFKFWRALTGVEYGAIETLIFELDKSTGTISSPFILHPEGFFQIIPLTKGWNWISLNVATSMMTRDKIFENILNSGNGNVITIKSRLSTTQYNPGANWNGSLNDFKLGEGYLLHLSNAPDTLHIVGLPSSTNIPVPVIAGWNWIGFPRLLPAPVNTVLSNLSPGQGNILKGQNKFATYELANLSWFGSLDFFNPGEGYKLFLSSGGTIIFGPSRSDGYEFDPFLYEFNMNVTGFADLSVIGEHDEKELIIGAFIDGECRGTGILEYVESEGEFRTFMLVHGNAADLGKNIEFRIKNDITAAEYITNGQQLTFVADGLIGKVMDPYLFFGSTTSVVDGDYDGYELDQNQPNPANGKTSISFAMPRTEKVLLRLYDLDGGLVKVIVDAVMNQGDHSIETDLTTLPGGIYYYEMRTENFVGVKKLVKQ